MNFDSDTNVIDVAIRRLRGKIDDDFVDQTDSNDTRDGLYDRHVR